MNVHGIQTKSTLPYVTIACGALNNKSGEFVIDQEKLTAGVGRQTPYRSHTHTAMKSGVIGGTDENRKAAGARSNG